MLWRRRTSDDSYRVPPLEKRRDKSRARSYKGSSSSVKRSQRERLPVKSDRPKPNVKAKPDGVFVFLANYDWGRSRLWLVGMLFTLLWLALWGRAYYLQMVKGPEYASLAQRQQTMYEHVRGIRGNIVDRNGNIMARSVDVSSVCADPGLIQDRASTATALAKILGRPVKKIFALLQEGSRFVWVERKVNYRVAEKIKAAALPGIFLKTEYERAYPYKHLAGQLLGNVNIDDAGIEGIEKTFQATLAGRNIRFPVERDAAGRRLMGSATGNASDLRGRDVRLTIDTQMQFFAEEALAENVQKYGARWGGCIVVNVPTGEVLVWAQYPFFNPNNIKTASVADRRNRLALDALEQGSTIKSFLIAAALEEKAIHPNTVIQCENGQWKLRKVTLHDTHPYGKLTADKILHVSSNIGAAKIGLMLGTERYREYLNRLGFGRQTGLPLPGEARGILRPANKWSEIDLATASFGQSFSATLIQMAQAYLCLASDGTLRPLRLTLDEQNAPPPSPNTPARATIFSPATIRQVRAMMREVVEEEGGTGKQARIPGMAVGGKTGTAQKADSSGKYGKGRVGSFVGIVPIENPRYLILVLLDEPATVQYGGVVAAPVFRSVAVQTMAYHGLLPDEGAASGKTAQEEADSKLLATKKKTTPVDQAKSPAKVQKASKKNSATVAGQSNAGARVAMAAPPRFPAVASRVEVPAVVGMALRNAVETFASQGVVPTIKGAGGIVARQEPEAGSAWPDGEKECTLWLEEDRS